MGFGEVGQRVQLGPGVGEVVAAGVDDRRAQGAVVTAGDDQKVDLEAGPLARVVAVGDAERVQGGPSRVALPRNEAVPADLGGDDGAFPFVQLTRVVAVPIREQMAGELGKRFAVGVLGRRGVVVT